MYYYYYLLHGGCGCILHFHLLLLQEVRMQTNANPRWAANTIADTRDYSILVSAFEVGGCLCSW